MLFNYMEKKDREEIERLMDLKELNKTDKISMVLIMQKYVDSSINICMTCSSQIKFTYHRLRKWYVNFKSNEIK